MLLSDNLAFRLGLHLGDRVTVPTPAGPREFRVEGTFVDYLGSLDLGAVVVADEQLAAIWNDRVRQSLSRLARARRVRVRRALRGARAARRRDTTRSPRGSSSTPCSRCCGSSSSRAGCCVLVAPLVGVIGVVNSQLATVVDRWTEIAMLRTIGVSRRDLARAVVLECGAVGLLGGPGGARPGQHAVRAVRRGTLRLLTGWRIPIELPLWPAGGGRRRRGRDRGAGGLGPGARWRHGSRRASRVSTEQRQQGDRQPAAPLLAIES